MVPLPLRELQLRLRALITSPLAPGDAELDRALAELSIRGDGRLSAANRVRVYADMYLLRMRDALASDFPALQRALGDQAFAALTRRYLAAHPSDRPSLRDLGRYLPAFVAKDQNLPDRAWQAELARLEWAMVESFDAIDQAVLRREDLESLAPEAWPDLALAPVRSLVLLDCTAPVDELRERILAGEAVGAIVREAVRLRVWRQDMTVFHRRMDGTEAAALERLRDGGISFADLCASFEEEDPAATALRLLGRWIEDDLLAAP